ncbi:hypothetical protein CBR_g22394 [Chara braunii]|uniref:EF-hand domain-containing protein n=1 Tax=Chara braunii TaxID=69332 RepID=A0A388JV05_CHABU|nr:hypothetical protein CBR_g22394 [Chara braunii]|eukprot:GBG61597.1 hypothetical protein CBR_g22394 [Chara braunii]
MSAERKDSEKMQGRDNAPSVVTQVGDFKHPLDDLSKSRTKPPYGVRGVFAGSPKRYISPPGGRPFSSSPVGSQVPVSIAKERPRSSSPIPGPGQVPGKSKQCESNKKPVSPIRVRAVDPCKPNKCEDKYKAVSSPVRIPFRGRCQPDCDPKYERAAPVRVAVPQSPTRDKPLPSSPVPGAGQVGDRPRKCDGKFYNPRIPKDFPPCKPQAVTANQAQSSSAIGNTFAGIGLRALPGPDGKCVPCPPPKLSVRDGMAFFGLTALGKRSLFSTLSVKGSAIHFHDIEVSRFHEEFQTMSKLDAAELERALKLCPPTNPPTEISLNRSRIPQLFASVLGRELKWEEVEALIGSFGTGPGRISFSDFRQDLEKLRKRFRNPPVPAVYKSNQRFQEDRHRHIRSIYGPTDVFLRPVTKNQEYGWGMFHPLPHDDIYYPLRSTDVTRKEGICIETYYGLF